MSAREKKRISLGASVKQQDRTMRRLLKRMGIARIENGVCYDKKGRIVGVSARVEPGKRVE